MDYFTNTQKLEPFTMNAATEIENAKQQGLGSYILTLKTKGIELQGLRVRVMSCLITMREYSVLMNICNQSKLSHYNSSFYW
jgi:hypothetical protein